MTKNKGNMYEFVTHTHNFIHGECYHDCSYCYMKLIGRGMLGSARLGEKDFISLGSENFIFVGSGIDMWAANIPDDWIVRVLDHCDKYENKYLFQTKSPERFTAFLEHPTIQNKSVLCTTLETNRWYKDVMRQAPAPSNRVKNMGRISQSGIPVFVTAEPLMDFDIDEFVEMLHRSHPMQVNIGRNTNRQVAVPEPSYEKVQELAKRLSSFTNIHIKANASCWK